MSETERLVEEVSALKAELEIAKDVHLSVVRRMQGRINELETTLKSYERHAKMDAAIMNDMERREESHYVTSSLEDDYGHLGQRI